MRDLSMKTRSGNSADYISAQTGDLHIDLGSARVA